MSNLRIPFESGLCVVATILESIPFGDKTLSLSSFFPLKSWRGSPLVSWFFRFSFLGSARQFLFFMWLANVFFFWNWFFNISCFFCFLDVLDPVLPHGLSRSTLIKLFLLTRVPKCVTEKTLLEMKSMPSIAWVSLVVPFSPIIQISSLSYVSQSRFFLPQPPCYDF